METQKLQLQAPWQTYFGKLRAIFGDDPEIDISADEGEKDKKFNVSIKCSNSIKANAIKELLIPEVDFNGVVLKINVEDTSDKSKINRHIIEAALTGNPHFQGIEHVDDTSFHMDYCVMKKEVIQFYNDDLSDYNCNYNGLAEDIMNEICKPSNISFCTSVDDNFEDDYEDEGEE